MRIQSAFRGHKARTNARDIRQHNAALRIQSQWRGYVARKAHWRVLRGVIAAQVGGGVCEGPRMGWQVGGICLR